jgi:hypothetical protein
MIPVSWHSTAPGKPLPPPSSDTSTQKAFWAHDVEFKGVKPDAIERFELQVRPFEAVEFRDVPLEAPTP